MKQTKLSKKPQLILLDIKQYVDEIEKLGTRVRFAEVKIKHFPKLIFNTFMYENDDVGILSLDIQMALNGLHKNTKVLNEAEKD